MQFQPISSFFAVSLSRALAHPSSFFDFLFAVACKDMLVFQFLLSTFIRSYVVVFAVQQFSTHIFSFSSSLLRTQLLKRALFRALMLPFSKSEFFRTLFFGIQYISFIYVSNSASPFSCANQVVPARVCSIFVASFFLLLSDVQTLRALFLNICMEFKTHIIYLNGLQSATAHNEKRSLS